jgi:hypothetical protein
LAGGGQVDAEGFFGEEVFAGAQHLGVDLGVKVVGQGDVDDIHRGGGQQFAVVAGLELDAGDAVEPAEHWLAQVGHGGEHGGEAGFLEGAPAGEGAGHFAAHEAASDDADVDASRGHECGWGEEAVFGRSLGPSQPASFAVGAAGRARRRRKG